MAWHFSGTCVQQGISCEGSHEKQSPRAAPHFIWSWSSDHQLKLVLTTRITSHTKFVFSAYRHYYHNIKKIGKNPSTAYYIPNKNMGP
jgi:hypothetical protein